MHEIHGPPLVDRRSRSGSLSSHSTATALRLLPLQRKTFFTVQALDQLPVNRLQRCRNHKFRNVLGHLPKDQHPQVKAAFRAAMKLDAKQGEQKLEQLARWLERDHPSASASLREGLSEMFTINRLGLPPRLRKCLGSTNLIDSTHSGVRQKTRRVTNWKNGAMALRWAAASFVETEKSYRRIIGYDQLWMLRAHLDDHEPVAEMRKAG